MSESLAERLTQEDLESYDRLRSDCGLLPPRTLSIFEIRGEDRKGWLQGQATNDLKQLDQGASTSFCLCAPTGQLLSVCDIWGLADRFILTCDRSTAPAVRQRFDEMVILEDVEALDLSEELELLAIQGPNASNALQNLVSLPTLDAADVRIAGSEAIVLRSDRTGSGGWVVLVPKKEAAAVAAIRRPFSPILEGAYEAARLEAGYPVAGQDWDCRTLPPELGPAFEAAHVSYRKGCYTGQEVLMRIHSRGHTNRTWVALLSDEPLAVGCPVSHPRRRDAGLVTSACYSPDFGFIAAAMLRNEAATDGDSVSVQTGARRVDAEVREIPILRLD